ncbi:MAG TPA: PEP-CTERM/exosortase system-associated acyltransferase [Candidatus Binatia bacterium]|jgi:N-acyl amino acid synthase of PEP-CTERM/exosortase system|nr:PEP-CTERM/exosortase system-associated acyltransferase [Candidatus Binatia bacterium]
MLEQEYDFYLADTDAGKSIHYNLRYQVYCLREKFEDPSHYPNPLERDEYDDASVHFIVRSRVTGEWLGAMRLIVAPMQNLPISRLSSVDAENFADVNRKKVAEASRLCTLLPTAPRGNFSANATKSCTTAPARSCHHNREALQTSWLALGLIRAARQYCLKHEIVHCFFLISDPLARMLRRLGMEIEPVGSPCQHRGWRRPYIHNVKTGYQAMTTRSPELYKSFCRPSAYGRFSELEDSSEALPLAACGGERRPVSLGSNPKEKNHKPKDHGDRDERIEAPFLISPAAAWRF